MGVETNGAPEIVAQADNHRAGNSGRALLLAATTTSSASNSPPGDDNDDDDDDKVNSGEGKTASSLLELNGGGGGGAVVVSGGHRTRNGDDNDDDLSFLAIKTELSIITSNKEDATRDRVTQQFSTGDSYLIAASDESSATNRKYNASPPSSAPLLGTSSSSHLTASDRRRDDGCPFSTSTATAAAAASTLMAAKHFRFSGDFTFRNTSVLSAFASSMGNLSDAYDNEDNNGAMVGGSSSKTRAGQYSNPSPNTPSSSNSILTELPTRFSFESSSTTSSSSSHLSLLLLQKPVPPRRIYQRNHGGSFDRKELLTNLTSFQSQYEDFESYISTQINRYGSVEKLMSYATQARPHEDTSKSVATDLSSLSLSPANRRRDPLGPSISSL